MLERFLERIRRWRRCWGSLHCARSFPATTGTLTLAVCHPSGTREGPLLRTVFRKGPAYPQMADVEIRGFLDGEVKFERNIATQYHVRIGCEASKPVRGRYEVIRALQRWDLSSLPREASIRAVRLVLCQEDISCFPHRRPVRWPVDFLLYDVRKPWEPGRGGTERNNMSPPERGDAWWREARSGELPWKEPGCGYGSDDDPAADRGAHPLAWARVRSSRDDLRFCGQRLTGHVQRRISQGRPLDLLIAASASDEILPGSIKAFFSAEYGDDLNPSLRPRLEVEWTAPVISSCVTPFVLEPGASIAVDPAEGGTMAGAAGECLLAASLDLDTIEGARVLSPEVRTTGSSPGLLEIPVRVAAGPIPRVHLSTAVHSVRLGDPLVVGILETWAPSAVTPDDLAVAFRFTAPSRRTFDALARHRGERRYVVEFRPDELGLWSYSWRTQPDLRFHEQSGSGVFTVVRGEGEPYLTALTSAADELLRDVSRTRSILHRRRTHFRLMALYREIVGFLSAEEARSAPKRNLHELRGILEKLATALPRVD